MTFSTVILAAGKGTRMYSNRPKVLHPIGGKPMVKHVIDTCIEAGAKNINLIYGYGGDKLQQTLVNANVNWVLQAEQLGTGHAVNQAVPLLHDDELILILYGDGPLISASTLAKLLDAKANHGISLLTVMLDDPTGYGRIIRSDNNKVVAIVEQKDATAQELAIKECNTGVLVATGSDLKRWLKGLKNNNSQGEYYLTDIIAAAHQEGMTITAVHPDHAFEVEGVNDRLQLARLERIYQSMQAEELLKQGVMIIDPQRFDLRGKLQCGIDCEIDINVIVEGSVSLGDNVKIGAGCILKDCEIDNDTIILPYTVIDGATVREACTVGPFARLRPNVELKNNSYLGNFVEIKNSTLGEGSKANHLTYIGDSIIGKRVNIGAGVITCNYDGANKHQTIIGDDVFVGSDSQLVAPVKIADGATIGAGTTLTRDVEAKELVITRASDKRIANWQRSSKK